MVSPAVLKKAPDKPGEFGATLAKRRSQDFKAKIQSWNDRTGEVLQKQDDRSLDPKAERDKTREKEKEKEKDKDKDKAGSEEKLIVQSPAAAESDNEPATSKSPASPAAAPAWLANRGVDLERRAWIRRKSKPQIEVPEEVKLATSPKKRVISDSHWRKDRPPKEDPTTEKIEDESARTPAPSRRSVANIGLKVPVSVQKWVDTTPDHYKSSVARERQSPNYEDSGIKVYVTRTRVARSEDPTRRDYIKPVKSGSNALTDSSPVKRTHATEVVTPGLHSFKGTALKTSPQDRNVRRSPVSDDDRRPRSSESHRPLERHGATGREEIIRPRTAERSHEKEARIAALTVPPLFGKRIEGWLAGTSDPFQEHKRDEKDSQNVRRERRKSDETYTTQSDDTTFISSTDASTVISTSTTPTLRRNGAYKNSQSPLRNRQPNADPKDLSSRRILQRAGPVPYSRSRGLDHRALDTLDQQGKSNDTASFVESSVVSRASDGDTPIRKRSEKRRLAKHSDLISVLSLPMSEDNKGIKSARSVRARRVIPVGDGTGEIMNRITADELRYQRELRTLVDGVIPVLLTHVLQKNDPSGSKRLFSGSSRSGQALTQPIVDMGVSLERLKSLHRRIPLHDPDELVAWASGAAKAYADYLKAWRLGFNDIVVNLAPAEEVTSPEASVAWESELPKGQREKAKEDGSEQVNVAYLLKRPLIRMKHLAKALDQIDLARPSAPANNTASAYSRLVKDAREKANDERARLEDEAAAGIDPTRARDPRSLALLGGVHIDPTRSVKARDFFDLDLVHSSGQQVGCKVELVARDDAADRGSSGDVLFCEVSMAGRWLLFPPIANQYISARRGDRDGEMVIMIRGLLSSRNEWRELISLVSEESETVEEWIEILGSSPIPSQLSRKSSFNAARPSSRRLPDTALSVVTEESYTASQLSSESSLDLPIGEPARADSRIWDGSEVNSSVADPDELPSRLRRSKATRHRSTPSQISVDSYEQVHAQVHARRYTERTRGDARGRDDTATSPSLTPSLTTWDTLSDTSTARQSYSVWLPSEDRGSEISSSDEEEMPERKATDEGLSRSRPQMHRRMSSVPTIDLPSIPKLRPSSAQEQGSPSRSRERQRSDHADLDRGVASPPETPQKSSASPKSTLARTPDGHATAQTSGSPSTGRANIPPSFTPAFLKKHRRTSSPLKHEYEPSTASESLDDSEPDSDDVESVTSESSAESEPEAISTVGDLKGFQQYISRPLTTAPPKPTLSPVEEVSLAPSDSASQGPYRAVPQGIAQPAQTFACLFCWAENGTWTSLHPEECIVFVGPGLIEAFDVTQAQEAMAMAQAGTSSPSQVGVKPLVALEMTPLVPLRRGTALDISVRSPPTADSLLRPGNNVMFRSRSAEECEKLYGLLNRARIDNPTYIALQNARGPIKTSNWSEAMDRQNAARTNTGSSWWPASLSRKSSTYRSKGSRAASTAATESSITSLNSAFSALRRFSGGSRMFNIAKSTLMSREGTRSSNSESLSSGVATPSLSFDPRLGTPMGVTNTKIRLYLRESASKWRDLGAARLTIMMPPRDDPAVVNNPRATGLEKRVLVYGQSRGETLLDEVLPETSFERVARTGMAVSVWQETAEPAAVGGVGSATLRVYMIQMKTEREAAFTFGLVGKLRY